MKARREGEEAGGDALVDRLTRSQVGFFDVVSVYLGDRLGLYRALAEGPATSQELARRTRTQERYVREWLEQQAVAGILEVAEPSEDQERRRYAVPAGHDEVLLDRESLSHLVPSVRAMVRSVRALPGVVRAFVEGGGITDQDHVGADPRAGDANRAEFLHGMAAWLAAVPDVDARLRADPPARIADVACGAGWSCIAMARAYPKVRVEGLDLDPEVVERAQGNVAAAGLGERVSVELRDAADPGLAGRYDLVTVFEALHDMARPVEALRAVRALLHEGASVLVADERVEDGFSAPGDEIAQIHYGWSVLSCLPSAMAEPGAVGTGAAMRPATLRRYAEQAGFTEVEVLPIEHRYWRFYRLRP